MKKNIAGWLIPVAAVILFALLLFRPAGRITLDKSVSENRILFKYEIFGCGSVVGKVVDGGEEITSEFVGKYPDIGKNEVVFTSDSDEPRKYINEADFQTGGFAGKYTYVIEGEPVGVTRGAPDCCEPKPAYNENAVEFRVDKWYYTSYVPYAEVGNILYVMAFGFGFMLSLAILIGMIICKIYIAVKSRYGKKEHSIE